MKIFERVYYSIIGKKVKSLLLLLVITLLGTFLSASFSIHQANQRLEKGVRENLTPVLLIDWKSFSDGEWLDENEIIKSENKINKIIEKYRNDERIKAYENRYLLYQIDFNHLQLLDSDNNIFPTYLSSNQSIFDDGELVDEINYFGSVELVGIDYHEISDIDNESAKLVYGRTFNEDEIKSGEDKCFYVIGYGKEAAYYKKIVSSNPSVTLSLDKLYITNYFNFDTVVADLNYTYSIEMIGLGQIVENLPQREYHTYETGTTGSLYVPLKVLDRVGKDYKEIVNQIDKKYPWYNDQYSTAKDVGKKYLNETYIEVKDANELSSLIRDLKIDIGSLANEVYSYSDSYNDVQGITKSLNTIALIALIVCSVASIILLSLIIQVFVNERRYEIGVYLSLGESKKNVITQILCEILLVGLLGISTSLFTGNMIGKSLSSDLLERQIKQHEEIHNGMNDQTNYEISQEEILDTYEVSITIEYIVCVYAGGLVVLLLSSVYPMNSILKMKAKKMLQ